MNTHPKKSLNTISGFSKMPTSSSAFVELSMASNKSISDNQKCFDKYLTKLSHLSMSHLEPLKNHQSHSTKSMIDPSTPSFFYYMNQEALQLMKDNGKKSETWVYIGECHMWLHEPSENWMFIGDNTILSIYYRCFSPHPN